MVSRCAIVSVLLNIIALTVIFAPKIHVDIRLVSSAGVDNTSLPHPTSIPLNEEGVSVLAPLPPTRTTPHRDIKPPQSDTSNEEEDRVVLSNRDSLESNDTKGQGKLTTMRSNSSGYCFKNRVHFQPTICSAIPDIITRAFSYQQLQERRGRVWHVAYVGGADPAYKIADILDRFGRHKRGVNSVGAAVGKELISKKPFIGGQMTRTDIVSTIRHSNLAVCGACCECAARNENDDSVPLVPFKLDALVMGPAPTFLNVSTYFGRGTTVHTMAESLWTAEGTTCAPDVIRTMVATILGATNKSDSQNSKATMQKATSSDPRGGETGTSFPNTVGREGRLDILSLEGGACDVTVVREVVVSGKVRPMLLEYTSTVGSQDSVYKSLVDDLYALGYDCYFFTIKPVSRRFRGQRPSAYPVAVLISPPCWRPIWGAMVGPAFHTTCHLRHTATLNPIFKTMRRITHKGQQYGCFAIDRIETWKDLTVNLTSASIEMGNAK